MATTNDLRWPDFRMLAPEDQAALRELAAGKSGTMSGGGQPDMSIGTTRTFLRLGLMVAHREPEQYPPWRSWRNEITDAGRELLALEAQKHDEDLRGGE
jgi:hypothetical protein